MPNKEISHSKTRSKWKFRVLQPYMLDKVQNYIKNQDEHHRIKSFTDEYYDFIKKYEFEKNSG